MGAPGETRLAFLFCTEAGRLERQSRLLARSIRTFGGRFADAPLFSFQPRSGDPLSLQTRADFARLGVVHLDAPINHRYPHYPLANKPAVAAFAERHIDAETLVFVDSDKMVLAEPSELDLAPDVGVAVRPVHKKVFGTTGSDDAAPVWNHMFDALGVTPRFRSRTSVEQEDIVGYWNSGLVAVRRDAGLFGAWQAYFERLMSEALLPPQYRYFREQISLAVAIHACAHQLHELPAAYNFPIALDSELVEGSFRPDDWSELVTVHYHRMFDEPRLGHPLDRLAGLPGNAETADWLRRALAETGVHPCAKHAIITRSLGLLLARWKAHLRWKVSALRRRLRAG